MLGTDILDVLAVYLLASIANKSEIILNIDHQAQEKR